MNRIPRVFVVVAVSLVVAVMGWRAKERLDDDSGGSKAIGAANVSASPQASSDAAAPFSGARSEAEKLKGEGPDVLLVPGLRDTLEALLFEAGEASNPEALKQRLAQLVAKNFPAEQAARMLALVERYVDYRVALGALAAPSAPFGNNDPDALRSAIEARDRVRLQYFEGEEYKALFAEEAELDRYTLARMDITRNAKLTEQQRADALRAAESELPPERRAERAAATAHINVAAQTAAFNAQGANDYQRHAERSAQYGEPAARALAQVDREEQSWQSRLDEVSRAPDASAKQALRRQLFTPEEQLRIDAALTLRALK